MDKRDLFSGHSLGDELLPDVLIDGKGRLRIVQRHCIFQGVKGGIIQRFCSLFRRSGLLGCGNIAEYQLGQLVGGTVPPDLHDILHTLVDFGAGFVREKLVDDPLVKAQLAAIRCDLEHIVNRWVHRAAVYFGRALGQRLYHFFLMFGRLGYDVVILHLRGWQMELVGGLDVRHFLKKIHQLRQIEKLGEAGTRPVSGPFRCQFQRRHRFPEPAGPAVKMSHVQFCQTVILQVPLHRIKLGHGVADRRSGGKNDTTAAGNLIHISTFREHIAGLLGIRCG